MVTAPEFSHLVPIERLKPHGESVRLAAGPEARARLAARFGLLALDRLEAELLVRRAGAGAVVEGHVRAGASLACVVSGEPVPVAIDEPVAIRFAPPAPPADDEVELSADDLDTMPIEGGAIDLGEAVAQSFALALPAYPRLPGASVPGLLSEEAADAARQAASPFAKLRAP